MTPKAQLLERIRARMSARLDRLRAAARETRDAATDPGCRAESKYDTRSLEASYLAAGQSRQIDETAHGLRLLEHFTPREFDLADAVDLGALVEVADGDSSGHFLLVPASGGATEADGDREVTLLSPESPLFRELLGKRVGDSLTDGRWIAEIE